MVMKHWPTTIYL